MVMGRAGDPSASDVVEAGAPVFAPSGLGLDQGDPQ